MHNNIYSIIIVLNALLLCVIRRKRYPLEIWGYVNINMKLILIHVLNLIVIADMYYMNSPQICEYYVLADLLVEDR